MKLNEVKPTGFNTDYSKMDRMVVESAVDFLGTLKAQLNYGKLDPNDNVTKNKIALFVGLLTIVRQFKNGDLSKEQLIAALKGVTSTGDKSNVELDIMHNMANNPKAVQTRDNIIASLQGPSEEDTPEVTQNKKATKQKFLVALQNMQNSFYSKIQPSVAAKSANSFKIAR